MPTMSEKIILFESGKFEFRQQHPSSPSRLVSSCDTWQMSAGGCVKQNSQFGSTCESVEAANPTTLNHHPAPLLQAGEEWTRQRRRCRKAIAGHQARSFYSCVQWLEWSHYGKTYDLPLSQNHILTVQRLQKSKTAE